MPRSKIESIVFLRFVASTLIVLYHTELPLMRLSSGDYLPRLTATAAGTDMLFVISGFVIAYASHGKTAWPANFVLRRAARIAPLYWLLTLFMLALYLAYPPLFHTTAFDPMHFFASLAFIPHPHPITGLARPFLVPGWALNYFMFFYVLFGLTLLFPRLRSQARAASLSLAIIALVTLRLLLPGASPWLDFYGAPITLEFIFGMLVAIAYLSPRPVRLLLIILGLAAATAIFCIRALPLDERYRAVHWGLMDTGLLCACLLVEYRWGWARNSLVRMFGEASFATYLTNLFSLALVANLVRGLGVYPSLGPIGTQVVMLVVALGVGVIVRMSLERPLDSWFRPADNTDALKEDVGGLGAPGLRRSAAMQRD